MNLCACGCGRKVFKKWHIGHNRRGVSPGNKIGFVINIKGYRSIYCPDHPRKKNPYIPEHILIMEKYLGRYLKLNEVVHHKNHNRLDNRIKNLQVLTKKQHDRETVLVSENCKIRKCKREHKARGLCSSHYGKFYRRKKKMPFKATRGGRWKKS